MSDAQCPGCGKSKHTWQTYCDRCLRRLPRQVRPAIADATHYERYTQAVRIARMFLAVHCPHCGGRLKGHMERFAVLMAEGDSRA